MTEEQETKQCCPVFLEGIPENIHIHSINDFKNIFDKKGKVKVPQDVINFQKSIDPKGSQPFIEYGAEGSAIGFYFKRAQQMKKVENNKAKIKRLDKIIDKLKKAHEEHSKNIDSVYSKAMAMAMMKHLTEKQ